MEFNLGEESWIPVFHANGDWQDAWRTAHKRDACVTAHKRDACATVHKRDACATVHKRDVCATVHKRDACATGHLRRLRREIPPGVGDDARLFGKTADDVDYRLPAVAW